MKFERNHLYSDYISSQDKSYNAADAQPYSTSQFNIQPRRSIHLIPTQYIFYIKLNFTFEHALRSKIFRVSVLPIRSRLVNIKRVKLPSFIAINEKIHLHE